MKTLQLPKLNLKKQSDLLRIKYLQSLAYRRQWVLIIYRLPFSGEVIVLLTRKKLSKKKISHLREINPEHSYFIFHPFKENQLSVKDDVWGYPVEAIWRPESGKLKLEGNWLELEKEMKEFMSTHFNLDADGSNLLSHKNSLPENLVVKTSTSKEEFVAMVETSKKAMLKKKELDKVVLSKIKVSQIKRREVSRKKGSTARDKHLIDRWLTMSQKLPDALASLVVDPFPNSKVGVWMGASPEILVKKEKQIFTTVSLAGTQLFDPKKSLNQVAWNQKEIEEQAYVSRYIIDCFKKLRLREYQEVGPQTVRAGNLVHLKSEFTTDLKKYYGETLPYDMLQLLHPTSAVCGTPKEESMKLIKKLEAHDRKFFAGFLGPMGIDNEVHIYVNLRCVQISQKAVCFHSGAGITIFSESEKEWLETENKIKSLEDIFK